MITRFSIFVDGSNLVGSLRRLNASIPEYQDFYDHIFEQALEVWKGSVRPTTIHPAQLTRVHWYQMGSMDELDLSDPKLQTNLREYFDTDKELKKMYMALAGQKLKGKGQNEVANEAWGICFNESKSWYENKRRVLHDIKRFNYGVRSSTDFIEIVECGHWKVDFLNRTTIEKGLDTRMAVDMVTSSQHFDVALVLSGDADTIPSVNYLKNNGRHVAVIDLIKGYPPERRGRQCSTKLQSVVDFVVPVYEMTLMQRKIAMPFTPQQDGTRLSLGDY